ncbi:hypothetical protein CUMW_055020 [Citrus unshiu]|nr:hypothetical protein CUMW_055020 [Citrus unshiu]
MVEVMSKETSHWWWFDSHNKGSKRSPWLQSTLAELDEKAKAMLKLIEEDADSFAQRAEMYYKKRPELISMVEEFYRAHRSLAERYDLVKSDHGTRLLTTFGSPFMSIKQHKQEKVISMMDQTYNSYSESSDAEEYAESEVDDPEQEGEIQIEKEFGEVEDPELVNETQVDEEIKEEDEDPVQEDVIDVDQEPKKDSVPSEVYNDEIMKLREEIETLKEENEKQKDQLKQKDEEKIEVIRQLSMAVGVLKDENSKLRKYIARESPKKHSPFVFNKLKGGFFGQLFSGPSKSPGTTVPPP